MAHSVTERLCAACCHGGSERAVYVGSIGARQACCAGRCFTLGLLRLSNLLPASLALILGPLALFLTSVAPSLMQQGFLAVLVVLPLLFAILSVLLLFATYLTEPGTILAEEDEHVLDPVDLHELEAGDVLLSSGAGSLLKRTPLHRAAEGGNSDEVLSLLAAGSAADVTDAAGLTPYHLAVRAGHRDIQRTLVQAGFRLWTSAESKAESTIVVGSPSTNNPNLDTVMIRMRAIALGDIARASTSPVRRRVVTAASLARERRNGPVCRVCRHGVKRYDHHCVWVNNCIGIRNYKFFVGFLSSVSALALCAAVACVVLLGTRIALQRHTERSYWTSVLFVLEESVDVVVTLALAIVGMLAVMSLCGFHVYLLYRGLTTYEFLRRSKTTESSHSAATVVSHHDDAKADSGVSEDARPEDTHVQKSDRPEGNVVFVTALAMWRLLTTPTPPSAVSQRAGNGYTPML